jgi:hypothetical protein
LFKGANCCYLSKSFELEIIVTIFSTIFMTLILLLIALKRLGRGRGRGEKRKNRFIRFNLPFTCYNKPGVWKMQ